MSEFAIRKTTWQSDDNRSLRLIRRKVFIDEQSVPEVEEWDDLDQVCEHFLAETSAGAPIGTSRLSPDGKIGRVAVLQRGRGLGVGVALMRAAMAAASANSCAQVELDAQVAVIEFYEKLGFVAEGEVFLDAGIPHRKMRLVDAHV